jgi:hypothetical protein
LLRPKSALGLAKVTPSSVRTALGRAYCLKIRCQSLARGLDVANHCDGLNAKRSQPVHDRAAYMPNSAGDEDQF